MPDNARLTGLNGLERHMMKTGGPLTPAQWTTLNPILDRGQIGVEVDPDTGVWGKAKLGDGDSQWNDLPYFNPAGNTGEGGGSVSCETATNSPANGTDTAFTFSSTPIAVFRNGVMEKRLGEITANTFTFDSAPNADDDIEALV